MKKQSGLATRMKERYQDAYNIKFPGRTNIIIRLDGKSFGKYTKGLETPFDKEFADDMDMTAKYLCQNIQGCKFAYIQSDEISLLITDYDTFETSPWFGNKLQKFVSVTASMATAEFNRLRLIRACSTNDGDFAQPILSIFEIEEFRMAEFDSRAFIIPEAEEVVNYFLWRQQDATRNSISMTGQKYFSHNQLHKKTTSEVQDMLMGLYNEDGPFIETPVNWNDFPVRFKRGGMIMRREQIGNEGPLFDKSEVPGTTMEWVKVDPPIFSKDRDFLLTEFKLEE